jgi:hypothetical protein
VITAVNTTTRPIELSKPVNVLFARFEMTPSVPCGQSSPITTGPSPTRYVETAIDGSAPLRTSLWAGIGSLRLARSGCGA